LILRVKVGRPAVESISYCSISRVRLSVVIILVVVGVVRGWRVDRRRVRSLVLLILLLLVSEFIVFILVVTAGFVEGVINVLPGAFLSLFSGEKTIL
jgi:hypothetical protein